jgi:acyl carrier protein
MSDYSDSTSNYSDSAPDVLATLEEEYSRIKRVRRDLRPSDRIVADLRIDSISAIEMLVRVEDLLGIAVVADPRIAGIVTVQDILDLVTAIQAGEATTTTAAPTAAATAAATAAPTAAATVAATAAPTAAATTAHTAAPAAESPV